MARPLKNTVDYFPHQAKHGKTMFILEERYENDGYAFWFKLLEILCSTENHVYYVRNPAETAYLASYCRVDENTAIQILDLLAALEAIDKDLWLHDKAIWCDNLVANFSDAYRNRKTNVPQKPSILRKKPALVGNTDVRNPAHTRIDDVSNTQTKLKETRVKETILNSSFEQFWEVWPKKIDKAKCKQWWERNKPDIELVDLMIQNIEAMKKTKDWEDRQFIPGPYKWLYGRRWEDEIPVEEDLPERHERWRREREQKSTD